MFFFFQDKKKKKKKKKKKTACRLYVYRKVPSTVPPLPTSVSLAHRTFSQPYIPLPHYSSPLLLPTTPYSLPILIFTPPYPYLFPPNTIYGQEFSVTLTAWGQVVYFSDRQ